MWLIVTVGIRRGGIGGHDLVHVGPDQQVPLGLLDLLADLRPGGHAVLAGAEQPHPLLDQAIQELPPPINGAVVGAMGLGQLVDPPLHLTAREHLAAMA
jgi:hypothetical protein